MPKINPNEALAKWYLGKLGPAEPSDDLATQTAKRLIELLHAGNSFNTALITVHDNLRNSCGPEISQCFKMLNSVLQLIWPVFLAFIPDYAGVDKIARYPGPTNFLQTLEAIKLITEDKIGIEAAAKQIGVTPSFLTGTGIRVNARIARAAKKELRTAAVESLRRQIDGAIADGMTVEAFAAEKGLARATIAKHRKCARPTKRPASSKTDDSLNNVS